MSNLTISVGGREFTVACAAGEEDHVLGLARMISERLARMGVSAQQGESRMLLFAALLLADELHERDLRPPPPPELAPDLAARLDAIAGRIENLATQLENEADHP